MICLIYWVLQDVIPHSQIQQLSQESQHFHNVVGYLTLLHEREGEEI